MVGEWRRRRWWWPAPARAFAVAGWRTSKQVTVACSASAPVCPPTRALPCSRGAGDQAYHTYSCRFGNFLADTEQERSSLKLDRTTPCVWACVAVWLPRDDNRPFLATALRCANPHPACS
jgi:hypothetical protein